MRFSSVLGSSIKMLRSYNNRTAAVEQLLSSLYVHIMECMYMYLRLHNVLFKGQLDAVGLGLH